MTPIQDPGGEPRWLLYARAELARGVKEIKGPEHNPRILEYFTATKLVPRDGDETAWCSAFVGYCLQQTGFVPSGSAAARSYLKWGIPLGVPRLGAIVVLSRGENPLNGHVGFWVGQSPMQVMLLSGNQADSVSIAAYGRWRVLGYRWPLEAMGSP